MGRFDKDFKKGECIAKLKYWFGKELTQSIFNDLDFIIEQKDDFVHVYEKVLK